MFYSNSLLTEWTHGKEVQSYESTSNKHHPSPTESTTHQLIPFKLRRTSLNLVLVFGLTPSSSLSYLTQRVHRAAATTLNSSSVSRKSLSGRSIRLFAPGGFGDFWKCARSGESLNSCWRVWGCLSERLAVWNYFIIVHSKLLSYQVWTLTRHRWLWSRAETEIWFTELDKEIDWCGRYQSHRLRRYSRTSFQYQEQRVNKVWSERIGSMTIWRSRRTREWSHSERTRGWDLILLILIPTIRTSNL